VHYTRTQLYNFLRLKLLQEIHFIIILRFFFSHYFKIFLWSLPISHFVSLFFYCKFSTHIIFILFIKNPLESHHHHLIFFSFLSIVHLSLRFFLFLIVRIPLTSYPCHRGKKSHICINNNNRCKMRKG
jgi:hypothetical protein